MSYSGPLPTACKTDLDNWRDAVFMWRGYCLELFSRVELAISQCLETIERSGVAVASDAHHPGARARLRELRAILEANAFAGHERMALKRLEEWRELTEQRAWVAHGRFHIKRAGVTIELVSHDGKRRIDHPTRNLTAFELLEVLVRMQASQIALVKQLGQVRTFVQKGQRT